MVVIVEWSVCHFLCLAFSFVSFHSTLCILDGSNWQLYRHHVVICVAMLFPHETQMAHTRHSDHLMGSLHYRGRPSLRRHWHHHQFRRTGGGISSSTAVSWAAANSRLSHRVMDIIAFLSSASYCLPSVYI